MKLFLGHWIALRFIFPVVRYVFGATHSFIGFLKGVSCLVLALIVWGWGLRFCGGLGFFEGNAGGFGVRDG